MLLAAIAICATPASVTPASADWVTLDQELAGLRQDLTAADMSALRWAGFVRASYDSSSEPIDIDSDGTLDDELNGFILENVRLSVGGTNEVYTYSVAMDFASGQGELIEAWIGRRLWGKAVLYFGRMRAPFLRTSLLPENTNLFIPRTRNAILWTVPGRDYGFRIDNNWDGIRLRMCQQNGSDQNGDKLRSTVRLEWDVLGSPVPDSEGAYGAADEVAVNVGVASSYDAGLDEDRSAYAADLALTWKPFALQLEVVDYGDGYDDPFVPGGGGLGLEGGTMPWTATASWLFLDSWEAAVRYEDFDEESTTQPNRTQWLLGVNKYIAGHDLKWQLNYLTIEDENGPGNDFVALGATLAF